MKKLGILEYKVISEIDHTLKRFSNNAMAKPTTVYLWSKDKNRSSHKNWTQKTGLQKKA